MLFDCSSSFLFTDEAVSKMTYLTTGLFYPNCFVVSVSINPLLWITGLLTSGFLLVALMENAESIELSLHISFLALFTGLYASLLFNESAIGFQ